MEVGSKSTFKSGSHIIVTVVRRSRDLCDYMRTRLKTLPGFCPGLSESRAHAGSGAIPPQSRQAIRSGFESLSFPKITGR